MARTFYDSLDLNTDIQLDLSMLEATGELLHDESKNHLIATRHGTLLVPQWQQTSPGRFGLKFNQPYPTIETEHYVDIPAAQTAILNFTATDYSLAIWFTWTDTSYSQILFAKYAVDVSGWEAYVTKIGLAESITVRHHHAATTPPGSMWPRTGNYSLGWTPGEWHLWGYSRIGATCQHYRDGQPITTFSDALVDPESSIARDVVIGCRFTHDANWFKGTLHRPRAWSRALSADEHRLLYRLGYP